MEKHEHMKQIEDEVASLVESPLYQFRVDNKYFPVIGEGSYDAHIVFVGEAPGETEARLARPFCGRSGKVLYEMLASIGIDRQKIYITNLVKDRPEGNRDPNEEEIELYGPFLDRQLEIIRPATVVMLGRYSMKYLFKKAGIGSTLEPINKMHGKVFEGDFGYGKVTLVPLYHPASGLYNPKLRPILFEDFKVLKKLG